MKNRYSIRLLVIVFLSAFAMGICYSCSDDDGEGVKVYEYREQIGKKIKVLTDLQAESQFGLREGMYPETSQSDSGRCDSQAERFPSDDKRSGSGGSSDSRRDSQTAERIGRKDSRV
ncbi:DUF4972 domain-containing protein [Bacteroides thetaiotaomicron]|nr:DUF4972 domain-containing protein [Bacteroides thetaiotaomicron]